MVHVYNEILVLKMNEILPFATAWLVLEGTRLSGIRKRQIASITYMWNIKNKIETDIDTY